MSLPESTPNPSLPDDLLITCLSRVSYIETLASSRVSVLDFWSHTWREAPNLQVKMKYPCASFFDGKIYVVEGFLEDVSEFSKMKVFDTKTQIWDHVTIPYRDQYSRLLTKITCIEGKVYLTIGRKVLAYDPKEGRWDFVEREMSMRWNWLSNCAIENVLYCYNEGDLEWYDKKVRLWKQIKGLRGLPEFARSSLVKLADYGGKMAVVWDKYKHDSEDKMIWCAVIALQRNNVEEIWGKVEWCDARGAYSS